MTSRSKQSIGADSYAALASVLSAVLANCSDNAELTRRACKHVERRFDAYKEAGEREGPIRDARVGGLL